ncbi:MAG: tetratricopeptide repeat protein [Phycisphaerae bacterium]
MFESEGKRECDRAQEFRKIVEPLVRTGDLNQAAEYIGHCWCVGVICDFLRHSDTKVRSVAAMALALMGDKTAIAPLVVALHDVDPRVNELADQALWAIWFRCGNKCGCGYLKCGTHHLKHGNMATAIEKFTLAIAADPDFAEAYNQRAIAHYLSEQYAEALVDCRDALAKMPPHFGAMAGMGHCHAQLGNLCAAQQCYRQALAINPCMEGIAVALAQIQKIINKPTL